MQKIDLKLLTLLLLFSSSTGFAATLHAVIAGDTSSPKISQQVQASLEQMNIWVKRIENNTGLKLSLHSLSGERLNLENLQTLLRELPVKADDVVIFYYAGQGFNSGQDSWPTLVFKDHSLELAWIKTQLQKKQPRLFIAVTDVGNEVKLPQNNKSKGVSDVIPDPHRDRQLFLQSKGYLVATSAFPEQLAGGSSVNGGYFTTTFLELVSSRSDWQVIATEAAKPLPFEMEKNGHTYQQKPMIDQQIITKGVNDVVADPTERLLEVSYTYLSGGSSASLTKESVLRSGDTFKIHLTPNKSCEVAGCYVYIVQRDSHGSRDLFPWPGKVTVANPIKTAVVLPADDRSYQLDDKVGEETILVFVSKQPFSEAKGTGDVVPDRVVERPCTEAMGCVSRLTFKHE